MTSRSLGFWLGGQPSSVLLPVAGRRRFARRYLHLARRDAASAHRAEDVARKIRIELEERGLHKEPLGVDVIELPVLFALQKEG